MNLPDQWTTGTVSANGIDLQYYQAGGGQPIVLAHGMFATGRCWMRLGSGLANEYEAITYDARGHGRSDAPETGYDIDTRVADLVGLVDGLELTDPILGGHSMGAATVAWAAADHPDLPRGVFLEDPSRFRDPPKMSMEEAQEACREQLRESKALSIEERIEQHYEDADHDDHQTEQVRHIVAAADECSPHAAMIAQEHPLVKHAFNDILCPTLVLRRDVDVDGRVKDLDVADRLANGRLVHVRDAGHHIFLDEYDAAAIELRVFLQRL